MTKLSHFDFGSVLFQELAGLGGDTKFVKHEVEFQTNKSLILDSVSVVTNYFSKKFQTEMRSQRQQ